MPRITTRYGEARVPALERLTGKAKCPFCPYNKKPMDKGTMAVLMAFNSGPTGRVYICTRHAEQLRDELVELLADAPALGDR